MNITVESLNQFQNAFRHPYILLYWVIFFSPLRGEALLAL